MSASPVSRLPELLATMAPALNPGRWAWCTRRDGIVPAGVDPVATMREPEGLTVVVAERDAVAHGWTIAFRAAWITLRVHSDLAAVGLTAAFARALGDAGIACNVVAGAHHDHLFVPMARASDAMAALHALQARSAG